MAIAGNSMCEALGPCEPCIKGKHACQDIEKTTQRRANSILGCVYSDLCGPMQTRSRLGYDYFATFVDDKSRKVFVYGLKLKSNLHEKLKDCKHRAQNRPTFEDPTVCTDGGGEYTGEHTQKYLCKHSIKHELHANRDHMYPSS